VRAAAAALLAAALSLLAGGCGGASGPTRASYAKRANHLCIESNTAVKRYSTELDRLTGGGDANRIFARAPDLIRRATATAGTYIGQLEKLRRPRADAAKLADWIADLRREQALLNQTADAFAARDAGKVRATSRALDALQRRTDAFARGYGMGGCAG
jgi:hypothetical protein